MTLLEVLTNSASYNCKDCDAEIVWGYNANYIKGFKFKKCFRHEA